MLSSLEFGPFGCRFGSGALTLSLNSEVGVENSPFHEIRFGQQRPISAKLEFAIPRCWSARGFWLSSRPGSEIDE